MSGENDHNAARAIGERLAALYREIGERAMRGLPVYNEALGVEAVGFRACEGRALGIVVTPWFMNVVLAPLATEERAGPPPGAIVQRGLPAATFDFTVGKLDGFGRIETCSLFSPMFAFTDMAAARAAAQAAMAALLDPELERNASRVDAVAAPSAVDRRGFLRGTLTERRP